MCQGNSQLVGGGLLSMGAAATWEQRLGGQPGLRHPTAKLARYLGGREHLDLEKEFKLHYCILLMSL